MNSTGREAQTAALLAASLVAAAALTGCGNDAMIGSRDTDAGLPPPSSYDECGNGTDDDADGRIDEDCFCGNGETGECFPSGRLGACGPGTMACDATGSIEWGRWGSCEGAPSPTEEVCDGSVDEDCDGAVDEGCPCTDGDTLRCGGDIPTLAAPCRAGEQVCRGGSWSACEGAVLPAPEVCGNEVDDDCDGTVDDPNLCACRPAPELCDNGVDDDCDGLVDEPDACDDTCRPSAEVCGNDADDDCDARVDEGCAPDAGGSDAGTGDAGVQPCDETETPDSLTFAVASLDGAPLTRGNEAWQWTGRELFVWGGRRYDGRNELFLDDGALYDPATDTWRPVSATGAPSARAYAITSAAGRGRVWVWGGIRVEGITVVELRDGGVYEPTPDAWEPVPTGGPAELAAAAWTGSEIVGAAPRPEIQYYDVEVRRWRSGAGFPGDPLSVSTSPVWLGDGWLYAGVSAPWWRYEVATDSWTMLPPKPHVDSSAGRPISSDVVLPLRSGRSVVVFGDTWVRNGYTYRRDDVHVLDLDAGTWTVAYRGVERVDLHGCARCDVAPGTCARCPDTAERTHWSGRYSGAAELGCGAVASFGSLLTRDESEFLPRLRWFDSGSFAAFTELPFPTPPVTNDYYNQRIGRIFRRPLGSFGWAINLRGIVTVTSDRYELLLLRR